MRLDAQQSLYDQVFELSDHVFIIDALLLIGCTEHLEVPFRRVLVKLLLVLVLQWLGFPHIIHAHFVCVLHENRVLFVNGEVG